MERKLAAILAADVVGYSRLIAEDEARTLDALRALRRESFEPLVAEHRGEVVKRMGDGWLVAFASVVDAAACAIAVQERLSGHDRIKLRIGVHLGDIVHEDEDIYGDGVNIAARLQEVAEPAGVLISGTAYESLVGRLDSRFEDAGEHSLKNISRPIRAWQWIGHQQIDQPMTTTASFSLLPEKPSIAVLPFVNMSNDPDQEFLADGIAEDLTTALSRFRSLFVIARTSTFTYKGQQIKAEQVAAELGVRYLIEGSVRKGGNRVRVVSRVIDTQTGANFASDRIDGDLDDIFELQDRITARLVSQIAPGIDAYEIERTRRKPADSLDAWEKLQQGLWHSYQFTADGFAIARQYYDEAFAADPQFAAPLAQKAFDAFNMVRMGFTTEPERLMQEALVNANKAIALDRTDALGLIARSRVNFYFGQPDLALQDGMAALQINPNDARAIGCVGYTYYRGKHDPATAIEYFDDAIRVSPRDPRLWGHLMLKSAALRDLGDMDAAIETGRLACQQPGEPFLPYVHLITTLVEIDRLDEAREALKTAVKLQPLLTVDFMHRNHPFIDKASLDRLADGLRRAGLPDTAND